MSEALGRLDFPPLDLGPAANPLQDYLDQISHLHGLTNALRRPAEPAAAAVGTEAVQSMSMPGALGFDPLVALPPGQAPITRSGMEAAHGQMADARDFGTMLALGMTGNAPGGGGGNALRAYHGTPHLFEPTPRNPLGEFSLEHVGTGEGAQAYGHGAYLAENERVARDYREALGSRVFFEHPALPGHDVSPQELRSVTQDFVLDHPETEGFDERHLQEGVNEVIARMELGMRPDAIRKEVAEETTEGVRVGAKHALDFLEGTKTRGLPTVGDEPFNADNPVHKAAWYVERNGGDIEKAQAALRDELIGIQQRIAAYGDNTARRLDYEEAADRIRKLQDVIDDHRYDLPVYKQPGHLLEAEVNTPVEHMLHWDKALSEQSPYVQERLGHLGFRVPNDPDSELIGAQVYDQLSRSKGGAAKASEALRDVGVPALRYLDAGSRAAGKGSHNVVIFDPSTVNIIRRYGIGGAMTGAGAAAAGAAQQE